MGGSGGGFKRQDSQKLKAMAQSRLAQTNEAAKKNCFISFANEDLDKVNLLRGQAKNENSAIDFNDLSLKEPFDSERTDYIKRKLREKIVRSSVTIVFCTEDSAKSKWVNWEVETSLSLGKRVICMYQEGQKPNRLPPAAEGAGNKVKVVPWSANAISAAIEDG